MVGSRTRYLFAPKTSLFRSKFVSLLACLLAGAGLGSGAHSDLSPGSFLG